MSAAVSYVICRFDDLPSQRARGFHLSRVGVDGVTRPWPIVVVRWGRQLFGYVNLCPHQGAPLDWERNRFLDDAGTRLICGKHGARFDIGTGLCVDGPCRGAALSPVQLSVEDGDVCVGGVVLDEEDEDCAAAED